MVLGNYKFRGQRRPIGMFHGGTFLTAFKMRSIWCILFLNRRGPSQETASVASLPRPCFITSRYVNEARGGLVLAVGRVRSKKKKSRKKKHEKIHPTQNTPRKPQQPGDRDHLETARTKTRPTRQPILARFHRYRVRGLVQLSQSLKTTNSMSHTLTDRKTD